jgi:hypothetical protein
MDRGCATSRKMANEQLEAFLKDKGVAGGGPGTKSEQHQ